MVARPDGRDTLADVLDDTLAFVPQDLGRMAGRVGATVSKTAARIFTRTRYDAGVRYSA